LSLLIRNKIRSGGDDLAQEGKFGVERSLLGEAAPGKVLNLIG